MNRGPATARPPVGSGVSRPTGPLADAVVLLRAGRVGAWTSTDPWPNEGTGGATYNATVGDVTPALSNGKFRLWDTTTDVTLSGFELADGDLWNPTLNVDGLTIAIDWQPLIAEDSKAYDHYDSTAIFESTAGFVLESLDIPEAITATLFSAKADVGVGAFGNINRIIEYSTARHVDVVRFDPVGEVMDLFRDGVQPESSQPGTTTGFESMAPAPGTPFRLINGTDVWGLAVWDRALSDAEIAALDLS